VRISLKSNKIGVSLFFVHYLLLFWGFGNNGFFLKIWMSEKDLLRDRLYPQQKKTQPSNFLRPKNTSQISPGLTTNKTQKDDTKNVPILAIPSGIGNRAQSIIEKDLAPNNMYIGSSRPVSVISNTPRTARAPTSIFDFDSESVSPQTYREGTSIHDDSKTDLLNRKAIPRGRPPNLIPLEFRPTSAVDNRSSRLTNRSTSRNTEIDTENTPRTVFRLKKSNIKAQIEADLELFRPSPYYSPIISDELWNDPTMVFYYIRLMKQKELHEEFLYFHSTPPTSKEPENSYYLKVVAPSDVNWDDYYTLSSNGVTVYKNNKVEFVKLDNWLRECSMYIRMKSISFFHKYEKWRSFSLLHSITRSQQVHNSNLRMSSSLFVVNSILRKAVLSLQVACNNIHHLSLVDVKSSQTLSLTQFTERQFSHLESIKSILDSEIEKARITIVQSCDVIYESTGSSFNESVKSKKKNALKEQKNQESKEKHYEKPKGSGKHPLTARKVKENSQNKPPKGLPASEMMVYTQLATQRFCYKRLSRFIRLCDYMLVHSLFAFVIQSYKNLKDFLSPRGNTSGGDITRLSTEMVVKNNKLSFSPSSEEMKNAIIDMWDSLVLYIQRIPLFSVHPSLAQYSSSYGWEEPVTPLSKIIQNNYEYRLLSEDIINRIDKAYSLASHKILDYEDFLISFNRNQAFDVHKIQKDDPPASFFGDALGIYRNEIKRMDALERSTQIDLLLIILSSFCDLIRPSPRRCLSQLHYAIPIIAETKVESLTLIVSDALMMLHRDPQDIHFFITQLEFRRKTMKDLDSIRSFYRDIIEFYTLITDNSIKASDESFGAYRSLGLLISQLENLLVTMNDDEENKIKKWSPSITGLLQQIRSQILDLSYSLQNPAIMSEEDNVDNNIIYLKEKQAEMMEIKNRVDQIQDYQRSLQIRVSPIDELSGVSNDLNLKLLLWTSYKDWQEKISQWNPTPFRAINVGNFAEEVSKFSRISIQICSGLPDHPLGLSLKRSVSSINEMVPVVIAFSNVNLTSSHWNKLETITGLVKLEEMNYSLSFLIEKHISTFVESIESISNDASNEAQLLSMLRDIEQLWDNVVFQMIPHQDIKDFYLVKSLDDAVSVLEDTQVQLSSIRSSRFVGAIKAQVDEDSRSMGLLGKCFDYISQFQINFNSLYKVFGSSDIQRELPTDSKELTQLERQYKAWSLHARDNPRVYKLCSSQKTVTMFEQFIETTERIQKSLESFLQKKRTAFPRFYFLSNENLLRIFAEARNPKAVQPFLSKIFEGIFSLQFTPNGQDILSMNSLEGEMITLGKCQTLGAIEGWMSNLEKSMKNALHRVFKQGKQTYDETERVDWIQRNPAQVVSVISQVYFAYFVESALMNPNPIESLNELLDLQASQLSQLADLVRCNLTRAMRSSVVALITLDVHSRDIVSELIGSKVSDRDDFEWTRRLRYYWDDDVNRVKILQGNSVIEYGYEYLGATSRLVVTPLTERCYLTLTSALQNFLGGSPAGPAGTGKTETVKDLAKAIGNFCVVFNCSDAVTVIQMESFFSGLAQTGSWACFDEFNRINSEVLSVIAEQILTVQQAVAMELNQFEFSGQVIPLNCRVGVFITMNPGYAGRTELPDNLKSLFRPIAMMVPDYSMIAEVILYSEGFNKAKPLAQKVTQLYQLSSQMLSQQSHYDFGMRALKSVLVMAGSIKRKSPSLDEEVLIIRAMRDSNLSKLLNDDTKLFNAIICDLFPGIIFDEDNFTELIQAISESLDGMGLQTSDFLVQKTIQLYQTIHIRHGVMLVGPTGGGKTTSRLVLSAALDLMGSTVVIRELNPKAVTLTELYGAYNLVTGEWKNGLVGKMFSEMASADPSLFQWIVFDGPVDALWIENMNTVLDDNKLLSLANSDRIKMTDKMQLLFEVGDLSQASPATVSRCGMVYYQPEDLGWRPLVDSWIEGHYFETRSMLSELFDITIDKALEVLKEHCKCVIEPIPNNLVQTLFSFFDSFVFESNIKFSSIGLDSLPKVISHIYSYAMCWAFGGIIAEQSRSDFDTFLREIFERRITYPPRKTLFDYYLSQNELKFEPWSTEYIIEGSSIIPTVDTVTYSTLLLSLISLKRPVMFLGESGCGKTSIIQSTLASNMNRFYSILFTLSARTTSSQIQDLLESKMQSKRKTLYGPPDNKSAILLIDDFSLPKPDDYGSQPPLELLRQLINNKSLYNRDELFSYEIEDLTIIASGISSGTVSKRFISQFSLLSLPSPNDTVLYRIFSQVLNQFVKGFSDTVFSLSDSIVKASITFYRKTKSLLLPTPTRSHYSFNLRDVTRVFKGILMTNTKSLYDHSSFVKLWYHENLRVFGDRMIDNRDRGILSGVLFDVAKHHLKIKDDPHLIFDDHPILWTDILGGYGDNIPRVYEEVLSNNQLMASLNTFSEMYKGQLVLFKEAVEHILRILRVLKQPQGHMLLVGMGGTGKRTIARFSAFVAEMDLFEPQPTKEYKISDFRNDLKGIFKVTGIQNKPIMFLITDEQIVDESFLDDINNILNSGEVPGLFEGEEYDQMINELVPIMKKAGESLAYDSLCKKFTSNVIRNLHIVLALSPIGGRFRNRCQIFPSLISCCTIDWYDPWPSNALHAVSLELLQKIDFPIVLQNINIVAELATYAHHIVSEQSHRFQNELNRVYYVTPALFIEFFTLLNSVLTKRQYDIEQKKQLLIKGIEKLSETNEKVHEMEIELQSLRPMLQKKAAETELLLSQLKIDREKVNEVHKQISSEEDIVKTVREEAMVLAEEAQDDLDKALPFLNNALAAVEDLRNRKSDLAVVKTFVKPPQLVVEVMEAVCLLNGRNPDWTSAKSLLAQTDFFNKLLDVHNQHIPESTLSHIRSMGSDPRFEMKKVMGVSESAACLFKWVTAIEKYVTESQKIAPKIKKRDEARAQLEEAELKLKIKQDEVQVITAKLSSLQILYEESRASQKDLQVKIEQCEYRLKNASQLTTALDSERLRWTENLTELQEREESLLGDSLLIALHVAYIGPFSYPYRQAIITEWTAKSQEIGIKFSSPFIIEQIASDQVTLREWQIAGLPHDSLSKQNGVLVSNTRRWPLLIDPQGQGRKWLLSMGISKTIRLDQPNYARDIENAIRIGSSVLIEDVGDTLDPGLQFILSPKIKSQSGRKSIRIGDKWVDFDPQFRLYITTKLSNPQYLPDVFIQLSVINFSVTLEGLEDQLLSSVVSHEMPELENQRNQLIVEISKDQKTLTQLMSQILHLLFTSKGNILDNETLITTLHEAKSTSILVNERLEEAQKTEREIQEKREVFRDVAKRGSLLYFVILELPSIDSMYQYSLEFFKKLFISVLDSCPKENDLLTKIQFFIDNSTYTIYSNISRGLFTNHRITYAFLIASCLLRNSGSITPDLWNIFLRGPIESSDDSIENYDIRIEPQIWRKVCSLSKSHPCFTDLAQSLNFNFDEWKDFVNGNSTNLPNPFNTFPVFQQLVIASCISRRKALTISKDLILSVLGPQFLTQSSLDLDGPFSETSNDTPLLFVLSQGADPRVSLERLAQKQGFSQKLSSLSLGQGRGPAAINLIKNAKSDGKWVYLQNCHLCPSFLPKLEQIIAKLFQKSSINHNHFRLFLSSMPTGLFPVSILRNSIKVTSEPPSGIKSNVSILMNSLTPEQWESCNKVRPWKKIIYSLAVFHSTIQERKRFGSLGFNKVYEWNNSDFLIAVKILHNFLSQYDAIPWKALKAMIGGVVYGGRVTDEWDRRCMNALLDNFLSPDSILDHFSFSRDNRYTTIPLCGFSQLLDHIKLLPSDDSPQIFGFHETAMDSLFLNQSNQMIEMVLSVQPKDSAGPISSKDDEIVQSVIDEMVINLPQEIPLKNMHSSLLGDINGNISSLTVVLYQEIERYNKLLAIIHTTLNDCSRAMKGELIMSQPLSELYRSIRDQFVPELWKEFSYPSTKRLTSWYKDLLDRINFVTNWAKKGEPSCFWFSGFFLPQSFLTAVLQSHSRKYSVPVDRLSFEAVFVHENPDVILHPPKDGVYMHGLYFDGACWNNDEWEIGDPASSSFFKCPTIHLLPKQDYSPPPIDYICPVYITPKREGVLSTTGHSTNFVVSLNIPTKDSPNKWVLRGTALLLSTSY